MELPMMRCGTWIKEADARVLEALRQAEKMPTIDELAACTGLSPRRVEGTLRMIVKMSR